MRFRIIVGLAIAIAATRAAADPAALQLFREGRELMKSGRLDEACDRFARSAQLERRVGTLLNLGDCNALRGRLASAWASFDEAATLAAATKDPRHVEAARRSGLLKTQLPYLTVVVRGSPANLVIRRNGHEVAAATWNVAIALDPDDYVFEATAPGYRPWHENRTILRNAKETVIVELVRESAPPLRPTAQPVLEKQPPVRALGIGFGLGGNSRERPLASIFAVGNLGLPSAMLRGSLNLAFSRYEDNIAVEGMPDMIGPIRTVYINAGVDYVWLPVASLGLGIGGGVGSEIDTNPIRSEFGFALQLRSSVVGRLKDGHLEAGLHLQLAFAASEVTLHALAGVTWLL